MFRDLRLQGEPFVENERLGGEAARKGFERALAPRPGDHRDRGERAEPRGHVVGLGELAMRARAAFDGVARDEHRQRAVAQGAAAGARRVGAEGGGVGHGVVQRDQVRGVRAPERAAQVFAGAEDRVGIDVHRHFARDVGFARQS